MALLEKRHSLLDGVVFSGGEPLMQSELIDHVKQVKDMGFLAGLHTSGAYPERFKQLLPHLDWVGFDIKAPFDTPPAGSNDAWASKYDEVTYTKNSEAGPKKSLDLLLASGIDYQTRTTFDPTTLSRDDLAKIDTYLAERGAQKNVVQEVRTIGVNPEYQERYKRHKAH
jgi:pyruvate formate lyase activating enzyme